MKTSRGGRNLLTLGIGATLIALITLSLSLHIYRISGDIYLDRSRPGFLPEDDEVNIDADKTEFIYADSGELDADELDEYLNELEGVIKQLDQLNSPYAATPLSDESLGIPKD